MYWVHLKERSLNMEAVAAVTRHCTGIMDVVLVGGNEIRISDATDVKSVLDALDKTQEAVRFRDVSGPPRHIRKVPRQKAESFYDKNEVEIG